MRKDRRLLTIAVSGLIALAGCIGPAAPGEDDSSESLDMEAQEGVQATGTDAAAPAGGPDSKGDTTAESKLIGAKTYNGHITFIVLGQFNPSDPLVFPTTFPPDYSQALLEMEWTNSLPTNTDLALMLHKSGMGGSDGMMDQSTGQSPLKLVVTRSKVAADAHDIIAYVPLDDVSLVLNQDFKIHVSFFTGAVPDGYTMVGK